MWAERGFGRWSDLQNGRVSVKNIIKRSMHHSCNLHSILLWLSAGYKLLVFSLQHLLRVVPVIGILNNRKAFKPKPNPAEVDAVFDVPLEMFIKDENRIAEEREMMGEKYLLHFFDYETENKKYLIWGLTAGILIRAASVVYQRPPAFPEQSPKYEFLRDVDKITDAH
ncbi:nudix hydrolase 15, mitochondrial-like [Gossypium australe]|uniref:Nudix hydrolase 15, mitochondrial-like n=1 Tax=Gossypium australe TaxID=47621 RepID=A0A5B6WCT3_9ROSI|nr:nudix hydrolase 15, mitochondrial-like [Gossypium australe]